MAMAGADVQTGDRQEGADAWESVAEDYMMRSVHVRDLVVGMGCTAHFFRRDDCHCVVFLECKET